jgi:NAD(P)-dependent dehydrogenase (short-subunit alcohol dehydrogenase family)
VVNDLGVERDGSGGGSGPAHEVVEEIRGFGGQAIANGADVADWAQVEAMIGQAVQEFGRLDTVVNNAGFLRDRMLANMSEQEWDSVIRVHMKGHFLPARHAIAYWRDQAKAGNEVVGRIVNTSSGAGLLGSIGQGNYAAAKAGIAEMTIQQAAEWGRYGVLVNAIAPDARTRMTEGVFYSGDAPQGWDEKDPANVSPLVVWLGSGECDVTGRVFEVWGGHISVADGWQHGPAKDIGRKYQPAEVGEAVREVVAKAPAPGPVYGAQ